MSTMRFGDLVAFLAEWEPNQFVELVVKGVFHSSGEHVGYSVEVREVKS